MKKMAIICTLFVTILISVSFVLLPSFSQEQAAAIADSSNSSVSASSSVDLTQEQQSKNTVHITKTSTNSYDIVDDSTGLVSAFDAVYTITGGSNSLNKSKDLIVSIIQDDYDHSSTVGYVRAENITDKVGEPTPADSLVNPFVDQQIINSTITNELTDAIDSAHSLNFTTVVVKCDFGMNIREWKCDNHGIFN
jgi:hypothetical protein